MNGHFINWLIGAVAGLSSLLLGIVAWIVKEHLHADGEHRKEMNDILDLIRQRQHDVMNDVAGIKAVIKLREKERK